MPKPEDPAGEPKTAGPSGSAGILGTKGVILGAVISALVVLVIGWLVARRWAPLLDLDSTMSSSVHAWANTTPWAVQGSHVLAFLGRREVCTLVTVLAVVVLLLARRWRLSIALVIVATGAPLITDVVKGVLERPRPTWPDALATETTYAYPSGHATAGLAVWAACGIACAAVIRRRSVAVGFALPWVIVGIAIGASRVVLGVHWPSDVIGGWCLALAVVFSVTSVGALIGLLSRRLS